MSDSLVAEVVVFDGFDELDAVGPYETLANAGRHADLDVALVTLDPAETVTASHGLRVEPDRTLGDPDLLVVPGGGWSEGGVGVRREYDAGDLPRAIAACHDAGATVASVCTGAMLLAKAGVLDGRPATTHAVAREDLAAVADCRDARVVDAGDVATCGGVTAGLDLAVHLVERFCGADVAAAVREEMEYEPRGDVLTVE